MGKYYLFLMIYTPVFQYEELTKEEQGKHAFFLALAALLGEGVFNFGELLAHKILESLKVFLYIYFFLSAHTTITERDYSKLYE